jgi:hypothetical protein
MPAAYYLDIVNGNSGNKDVKTHLKLKYNKRWTNR